MFNCSIQSNSLKNGSKILLQRSLSFSEVHRVYLSGHKQFLIYFQRQSKHVKQKFSLYLVRSMMTTVLIVNLILKYTLDLFSLISETQKFMFIFNTRTK